ncbi:hypothetical protein OG866_37100 [Streptomyces sp. NBC_00663]|uniref:hypothetical protein n=1 Tax=Streptomyces sp. NBC_00663 TaxID=2975801 RepID=UPI002E36A901|nr:hypothetical protein [Streptomyces sp. NBC_00663]
MTDSVSVPRRSALCLLGGAIAVVAAATGGFAAPAHARTRPGHGAGPRVEGLLARLTGERKRVTVRVGASAGDLRLRTRAEVAR